MAAFGDVYVDGAKLDYVGKNESGEFRKVPRTGEARQDETGQATEDDQMLEKCDQPGRIAMEAGASQNKPEEKANETNSRGRRR